MRDDVLWQTVLGEIELTVSRGIFVTWFKHTRVLRRNDQQVVIGVTNIFAKQQFESKYKPLIISLLEKNGVNNVTVEFKIHSGEISSKNRKDDSEVVFLSQPTSQETTTTRVQSPAGAPSVTHSYRQGLNERYTFDTFVVGSGNELGYAACQAIAQNPGTKYNPLFMYGGVGLGKTHLIQAVGNAISANNPKARVVYISSEQFVQEFLDAIRYKKISDFTNFYRNADVLIVDDMQFIAGKEKTQEEFFHTFNILHQSDKQIIISSDKPPKSIPTLEERLRSRFEMGMIIDIGAPDLETRCAIIQNKAVQQNIELDKETVEFLATQFQTNIRELEGALNHLLAFCEMRVLAPDINIAKSIFGSHRSRPKHMSSKQIIEKTAKHYQITVEDILSPKRDKDIVVPRQVAMYLLRSELHLSFPKIAHELGRKDHTTAMHSIDKIQKEMPINPNLKDNVTEIKDKLYA